MSIVKKPVKDENSYLETAQPEWLTRYESNPTLSLDLSVIYKDPLYWNVDLTVTDAGMPPNHRRWLTKYLLPRTRVLIELNVEGCNIGDSGLDELAEVFKENTTLRKLNLKDNFISAKKATKFLDVLEEFNVTLCGLEIDEGDRDAVTKNKNQHDSFDLSTVATMLQANESEQDKLLDIQKRAGRLNSFNKKVIEVCIYFVDEITFFNDCRFSIKELLS